jgi:hypothetical protein
MSPPGTSFPELQSLDDDVGSNTVPFGALSASNWHPFACDGMHFGSLLHFPTKHFGEAQT